MGIATARFPATRADQTRFTPQCDSEREETWFSWRQLAPLRAFDLFGSAHKSADNRSLAYTPGFAANTVHH